MQKKREPESSRQETTLLEFLVEGASRLSLLLAGCSRRRLANSKMPHLTADALQSAWLGLRVSLCCGALRPQFLISETGLGRKVGIMEPFPLLCYGCAQSRVQRLAECHVETLGLRL